MRNHPPKRVIGLRLSALIELALLLAVMLVIDVFLGANNRFWNINPHPFWLIVLLLAGKYGTREGVVAALLCSFIYLFDNMPIQEAGQDMYGYWLTVLKMPLLWLVAGVVFGELRQSHIRERDGLVEEVKEAHEREDTISRSYEWVKQLKERLELRVAGQLRSSVAAYRAAQEVDKLSPNDVLYGIERLVESVLHPEKFSLYTMSPAGLELALTHGWAENDGYLRRIDRSSPLFEAIASGRQLCVINADEERLLGGQAILAGAMIDRASGEVVGMLKVESLGFSDLNLTTVESFQAICEWAGASSVNARKYQTAREDSVVNPDHNLLSYGYFQRYLQYINALAKRVGFDVTMLVVRLTNAEAMSVESRRQAARLLADATDRVLRSVDLAFDYQKTSDEFSIILPATPRAGAQVVLDKIRSELLPRAGGVAREAQFSFSVQTVYEQA